MFKRILITVDLTPLAHEVLNAGAELARRCGAEAVGLLHVVHQAEPILPSSVEGWMDREDAEIARRRADLAKLHLHFPGIKVEDLVVSGMPREEISNMALAWRPDLIVVGDHDRHGLAALFTGNKGEHVAHCAKCSVLIVRHQEPMEVPPMTTKATTAKPAARRQRTHA